jgi:glycosyltransferase involved in cell wall biosynthesis
MHGGEGCRRVLMTADAVGGVWDYSLQLAEGLGTCGVEVTLATMGPLPRDDQRAAAREVPGLRLVESDYRLEWAEQPWDDVARAGSWLLELEAQAQPDIVHLNGYAHGALAWNAPALVVAHSCVCSWWRAVRGAEAPEEWAVYRRAVREGLRAATAVVAPSAAMLHALSAHYGAISGTVVPNGRDAAQFRTGPKEPLVLSAGRLWDEAKNVAALASIAHGLAWPVALAGETQNAPGEPVHDGPVEYLGRLSSADLRSWMARASIYAMPARYEPFGLSILEAGLSGCALVLGDIPSLREHWDGAAAFVAPDDREALRSAIEGLIDSPTRRSELGRRARDRGQEFTVGRMADAYRRLYEGLLCPSDGHALEVSSCAS